MQEDRKLEQTVTRIVAECLEKRPEEVHLQARLVKDLGADSLDLIELQMALEEELRIDFDAGASRLRTVQDAVTYVHDRFRTSAPVETMPVGEWHPVYARYSEVDVESVIPG